MTHRKVVVVSGAGSGIGRAIALAFAASGTAVVAADIDLKAAEETRKQLVYLGANESWALQVDVADGKSVSDFASMVQKVAGPADVLLNVAGLFDHFLRATDIPDDLWRTVLNVNLTGPFLMSKAFLPSMAERKAGVIINVSSIAGLVAGAGGVAYTASKHGIIGLTRQLAEEWGPEGIRVNAICPGIIATDTTTSRGAADDAIARTPARRIGGAEEIAALAVFLAGRSSNFIQGAAIPIDGGWTAL